MNETVRTAVSLGNLFAAYNVLYVLYAVFLKSFSFLFGEI